MPSGRVSRIVLYWAIYYNELLLLYAYTPLLDGLGHAMQVPTHRLASCVIVSGFREALVLDPYLISKLIRPRCA